MPMSLTNDQAHVVRVFAELANHMGCAPTMEEIAAELDLGKSDIARYLDQLDDRGWLWRDPGRARGTRLLADPPPAPPEYAVELTAAGTGYLDDARDINVYGCGPEPIGPRGDGR